MAARRLPLVVALCLIAFLVQAPGAGAEVKCEDKGQALSRGIPPATEAAADQVKLSAKTQQFTFGEDRDEMARTIVLAAEPDLPAGAKLVAEPAGDLEAEGGGDSFPLQDVTSKAVVNGFGDVLLTVCLDAKDVGRGRYVGSVQVGGVNVTTASVALEATLRDSFLLALILALFGMIIGLGAKVLADLTKDPEAEVKRAWIAQYVRRGAFAVAALLGLLGVVVSLWKIYDLDPTWGSSEDLVKIVLAGVALQVTGGTFVDFVKPFTAKPLEDKSPKPKN